MGANNKKKKAATRLVLDNPLNSADSKSQDTAIAAKAAELISGRLCNIFPDPVTSNSIHDLCSDDLAKLATAQEKRDFVKAEVKRRKAEAEPPKNAGLAHHISVGMKKCLRDLKNGRLTLLILEKDLSTVTSLTSVISQSTCPTIQVNDLARISKETFGFTSTMIGVKDVDKVDELKDFADLAKEIKIPKDDVAKPIVTSIVEDLNDTSSENVKPKRPVTKPNSSLLLQRPPGGERAFRPNEKSKEVSTDFGSDFISFDLSDKPKNGAAQKEPKKRKISFPYVNTKVQKK